MIDIIVILVKYFDFKITNIFYNDGENNNISDLNNYIYNIDISNYNYLQKLEIIFYNNNNNIVEQCVNLFDFPPNFS